MNASRLATPAAKPMPNQLMLAADPAGAASGSFPAPIASSAVVLLGSRLAR
jgi:hypothetical protein